MVALLYTLFHVANILLGMRLLKTWSLQSYTLRFHVANILLGLRLLQTWSVSDDEYKPQGLCTAGCLQLTAELHSQLPSSCVIL